MSVCNPSVLDSGTELVQAICNFVNDRPLQAAKNLIVALLLYPPVRHIICLDFDALSASMKVSEKRGLISPDSITMIEHFVTVTPNHPRLEAAFTKWLSDPVVADAELQSSALYDNKRSSRSDSMQDWEEFVQTKAHELSLTLTILSDET